jgi:hypothetical protein
MPPPLWKSLLSYLQEIRIEDVPSYLNPHLYVTLSNGRYQLSTQHAIYSYGDLYGNFRKTFQKLRWDLLPGSEVLLLGFGLGSIPYMLEHKFNKSFRYTAVEADEQVIYLAGKYIMPDLKSVTLYHADAAAFMPQSTGRWDMICVDIFVDDEIPPYIRSTEFMYELNAHLSPGGILLFNTLSRTKEDVRHSQQILDKVFLPVFPDGGYLPVGGNWMLTNDTVFFSRLPTSSGRR